MARSDKAPFKREYTIAQVGKLPEEIYVGDIKTLFLGTNPVGGASGFIEGRVGKSGKWFTVEYNLDKNGISDAIDIRNVEYIRFEALTVSKTTQLAMFGYYDDTNENDSIFIKRTERELERELHTIELLTDIKEELQKLNIHMSLVTDEEIK